MIRSYLKKRILVQYRGGREVQTDGVAVTAIAGILAYFEDLNRAPNPAEKGGRPKDFFEMASNKMQARLDQFSFIRQECLLSFPRRRESRQLSDTWTPAYQSVSQLTEVHLLLFCHSREGGNPVLFQGVRFLDAGSSPA